MNKLPYYLVDKILRDYIEQEGITLGMRDIFLTICSLFGEQAKRIEPMMKGGDSDENV